MKHFDKDVALYYLLKATSFGVSIGIISAITFYYLSLRLSFSEIGTVMSVFAFTLVIVSYPVGYLSDFYGKKKIIGLGLLISITSYFLFGYVTSYSAYVFSFFLSGLGLSAWIRNVDAWIIDMLRYKKEEKNENKVISNGHMVSQLSMAFGAFIIYLTDFSLPYYFYLAAGFHSLSFFFVFTIQEPYREEGQKREKKKTQGISSVLKGHPVLFSLFIAHFFIAMSMRGYQTFWQLHIKEMVFSDMNVENTLSLLFILFLIGRTCGSYINKHLSLKYQGKYSALLSMSFLFVICLLLIKATTFYLTVALFTLFELFYGILLPSMLFWINSFVNTDVRSRINNVDSSFQFIGQSISSKALGHVAEYSLFTIYPVMAAMLIFPILLYVKTDKDHK